MQEVEVVALREFISPVFGNISTGQRFFASPKIAAMFREAGFVKYYVATPPPEQEQKKDPVATLISQPPTDPSLSPPVMPAASTSALQAGQVSRKQTVKPSAVGGKKKAKRSGK